MYNLKRIYSHHPMACYSSVSPFLVYLKVRIPSKDKLDRQVAYLSNKVWKAESKKEELYFHEATKKNIGALVESSMSQFTPLVEKWKYSKHTEIKYNLLPKLKWWPQKILPPKKAMWSIFHCIFIIRRKQNILLWKNKPMILPATHLYKKVLSCIDYTPLDTFWMQIRPIW